MGEPAAFVGTAAGGLALAPDPGSPRRVGPWRSVLRRFLGHRLAALSLAVLGAIVLATLVGRALWHFGHAEITADLSSPPSWSHPMGTDGLGRDLFAQVLAGTQKSLQVALVVTAVSTALGAVVGAIAGYYRGPIDAILMRLADVVLSLPGIAVLAVLGGAAQETPGNWFTIALLLSSLSWPGIARVVRAVMLSLREREFVEAARAIGARPSRILFRHLLSHASGPILVRASLTVGGAILAEAALSFLGLGLSPPDTSLGILIASGQHAASTRPWLFYFPGLVIVLVVLSVNFVGDGIRDALDPTAAGPRPTFWPDRRRPSR